MTHIQLESVTHIYIYLERPRLYDVFTTQNFLLAQFKPMVGAIDQNKNMNITNIEHEKPIFAKL